MMLRLILALLLMPLALAACQPLDQVGRAPDFAPLERQRQHHALYNVPPPEQVERRRALDEASLWSGGQRSLLGDRRASRTGDLLTVVIEIDDRAEMTNASDRNRTGSTTATVPQLYGLTQGIGLTEGVNLQGGTQFRGGGSVSRSEQLTLRVATTVIERLPNGILKIEGSQEVRVNNELRELLVSGFIRPEDISRRNEIAYDRIAGARISYGGRGQITAVQQPRYGQQIAEILLPF
jgi:flagellar L-ring protein precursor FlgH